MIEEIIEKLPEFSQNENIVPDEFKEVFIKEIVKNSDLKLNKYNKLELKILSKFGTKIIKSDKDIDINTINKVIELYNFSIENLQNNLEEHNDFIMLSHMYCHFGELFEKLYDISDKNISYLQKANKFLKKSIKTISEHEPHSSYISHITKKLIKNEHKINFNDFYFIENFNDYSFIHISKFGYIIPNYEKIKIKTLSEVENRRMDKFEKGTQKFLKYKNKILKEIILEYNF